MLMVDASHPAKWENSSTKNTKWYVKAGRGGSWQDQCSGTMCVLLIMASLVLNAIGCQGGRTTSGAKSIVDGGKESASVWSRTSTAFGSRRQRSSHDTACMHANNRSLRYVGKLTSPWIFFQTDIFNSLIIKSIIGLHNQGIYRVSGAASHIRKVKSLIEQGKCGTIFIFLCASLLSKPRLTIATTMFHLAPEDYSGDINSVTGALKLWFRELPDPLIPRRVSDQFIAAASTYILARVCVCITLNWCDVT